MRFEFIVGVGCLVFSLLLVYSFIFSSGGILETYTLLNQISEVDKKIEKLNSEIKTKKELIHKIKNDPDFRKSFIKGLGFFIEENEYIFKFKEPNNLDLNYLNNKIKLELTKSIFTGIIILVGFLLSIQSFILLILKN